MRRILQAWCYPCIALGLGLVLLTTTAYGQVASHIEPAAMSSRDLVQTLIGILVALGGAYVAGMKRQFEKDITTLTAGLESIRKNVHDIEVDLPTDYHTKADIEAQLRPIKDSMDALHRRLDAKGFPTSH